MLWYFFCFPKPCFRLVLTVLVWKLSYCWIECTFGGIQYLLCVVYDTPLIHTNDSFSCNLCICIALKIPVNIASYCTENWIRYDLSQQNSSLAENPKPLTSNSQSKPPGITPFGTKYCGHRKLLSNCKLTTPSELCRGLMRDTSQNSGLSSKKFAHPWSRGCTERLAPKTCYNGRGFESHFYHLS